MAENGTVGIAAIVLAHNEERRIGACLASILGEPGSFPVHVVVNGSTDATAAIARRHGPRVVVHDYAQGGKARSWSRFVLRELTPVPDVCVFADGDAVVLPGSIATLVAALGDDSAANAAAAIPRNGCRAAADARTMMATHGLYGDLYALRGSVITRMRALGIALPDDLVGDDGLIGAMAKTDLANEADWSDRRVIVCPDAGFLAEPVSLWRPASWTMQYRRMISYSIRHFQNRIISAIMRDAGPAGLPRELASLYPQWLPRFAPRGRGVQAWFDARALARMRASVRG